MPTCTHCGLASEQPFRFCPSCGSESVVEASHEQRRTVTVVFCDLAGSTALGESVDPERLRGLLASYFERLKAIVESHGGTVEKFIGDAVMAVFGVPVVHEDDALRAVRAATEMRDALPELELEGRIGVMTGEVVTGTAERLVTGDAVNVAARLEQATAPGEVLIGEPTLQLLQGAVAVEAVEPLRLKGKAQPVVAYRLLEVHDVPERRHETGFVGRDRELGLVHDAWRRVQSDSTCELVTIVGEAGIGKSRLVAEALAGIHATILRGRCLPYGEGITYWPVVEVLKQVDMLPPDDAAASAIRALLGELDADASADDIAWATRKSLEHAAATRPLIVVFDDIQWGEQTFHDLIEHVALFSTGAPILLLCMARPELTERRPTWPVSLRLEALTPSNVDQLIGPDLSANLQARIVQTAAGNPLFLNEMLALAATADGDVPVPPTLQALLAARLDQLDPAERAVLECGAIEGEIFHRGAVQALTVDDAPVSPRLAALVRKQLIQPDSALIPGDDGFRFRHLLLRDTAYDALPKTVRADLHERFADWVDGRTPTLVERDEIVGYHLEQALRYRFELGPGEHATLAARARSRLVVAGDRAHRRADYTAAARLFIRAAALAPEQHDLGLEISIADALFWSGAGEAALERLEAASAQARIAEQSVAELATRIHAGNIRLANNATEPTPPLLELIRSAVPAFEAAQDDVALYAAHNALAFVMFQRAQTDAATEAFESAMKHARAAGLPQDLLGWTALCRANGSVHVTEMLAWLEECGPGAERDHWCRASRATALSMLGRFDEARAIFGETRVELESRGAEVTLATLMGIDMPEMELLAGDPAAAVELSTEGCRLLGEIGDASFLSTAAATLSHALYQLDRLEEAAAWAERSSELGATDDIFTQLSWRTVQALVLARRGRYAEAHALVHEAVALGTKTDWIDGQARAYEALAGVHALGGTDVGAAAALEQAHDLYERKGNLVSAARVAALLAALRGPAPQ